MGNTPTPLRHAIRTDNLQWATHLLDEAGDKASDLINQDHSPDCVMQSCSRVDGNALYYAVDRNKVEITKLLLERGGDVYTSGRFGETCLHNAARHNQIEIAQALLDNGCHLYVTDDQGRYPIHAAARSYFNTTSIIKFLVEDKGKAEDINLKDFYERTALHDASYAQNLGVIKTLVEMGVDVNCKTKMGDTPLHEVKKATPTWDLLVSLGADVNIQNNDGQFPGELVHSVS